MRTGSQFFFRSGPVFSQSQSASKIKFPESFELLSFKNSWRGPLQIISDFLDKDKPDQIYISQNAGGQLLVGLTFLSVRRQNFSVPKMSASSKEKNFCRISSLFSPPCGYS